jgi:hypothetical protein
MQLLPYYRNEFISSCLVNDSGWTEALFDNNVSLWQRERARFHELFRIMNRDGEIWLDYSVILPLIYVRIGSMLAEESSIGITIGGVNCQYDDEHMMMTYSVNHQQWNGSVARLLFKARSEIAHLIDFSGAESGLREIVN